MHCLWTVPTSAAFQGIDINGQENAHAVPYDDAIWIRLAKCLVVGLDSLHEKRTGDVAALI